MPLVRLVLAAVSALSLLQFTTLQAADWPQYRGPDQTGSSAEQLTLRWPGDGPKVLWKTETNRGFSSFAISGGKALTEVIREIDGKPREVCVALDAKTGKELWATDVGIGTYDRGGDTGAPDNSGGDGPRSTPTLNDGRVYVATQDLVLHCLDAETGHEVWTKDLIKDHAGRNIQWKSAASPVIDGDLVFIGGGGPGQSLLALQKKTGEVAWKSQDETITHATPVVATILGQRQVIFFLKSGLVSVAAQDGKALWKFPFDYRVSTAASPVVCGDIVYCSAGYDVGGGACRIKKVGDEFQAEELYKIPGNRDIPNHWSTPCYKDGYLYGMFSFKKFANGPLKCVEVATGKIIWEQAGFGAGNVIRVNDQIVALTDFGEVVIVEATPTAYKELARAKAITGKCWSTPALSDGRLYVRSTKEGACLDVAGQ